MNLFYMAIALGLGTAYAILFSRYDCKNGQLKMANAETSASEVTFECKSIFDITN